MKHGSDLKFTTIVVIIIGLIIGGSSFQDKKKIQRGSVPLGSNKPAPAKDTTVALKPGTYAVTLSIEEWSRIANGMQHTMGKIRYSDLPSRDVSIIIDSIFVPLLSQLQNQISSQVQAEEKAKADAQKKVDSAANKNKKQLP